MLTPARVGAVAVAVPPLAMSQAEADDFLTARYGRKLSARSLGILHKVFAHPSIRRRHFAVESPECAVDEDPDLRVERFLQWAIELTSRAARDALAKAGLTSGDVSAMVVNTCTGYVCPGLSTYLLEALGLPRHTRVYDLVGAGCGGAIPNLELCQGLLNGSPDGVALSISVEICTATFQMGDDLSLIVSNALFADGAAACVLWTRPQGLALADSASLYAPEHRDAIRYVHKGGQLHNQLSLALPKILEQKVAEVVSGLLARHGLRVGEVRHWAVHPGGGKVINAIQGGLGLTEEQVRVSREVLAEFGNMSSPTVWFEMERLMANGIAPGDWVVMVGAGAGLSAHAALFRA